MGKITYEIPSDLSGQKFSTVEKSDQEQAARMSRRMSRLVARRPDLAEAKPEIYAKYKDREAEMQERASATRERHREEKPGVVHEDLEQDDGSEDVSRSNARPLDRGPVKSGVGSAERKIKKGSDGHVATIAVTHKDSILMGKRRDNGKWTNPGGHMEPGEDAHSGAIRELKEESGIEADKVKKVGEKRVKTHTGRDLTIHAFHHDVKERPKTSMVLDPDQEVEKWQWIKHKDGKLPDHVKENLHSPKNVVLEVMGLNKGGPMSGPQMKEYAKKTGKESVGGGVVDKDIFYAFRKKGPTEKKTDTPAELMNKARFFVTDILKSGSHKYIRKYQKNGEWIYIYHEGDQHGRMAQEDIDAHHHLAQHGEEHERAHHAELLSRVQTMTEEDVEHHKLLSEHGDDSERAHHASILKILGHKKEEEKKDGLGKLERTVTQAERQDDVDKELSAEDRAKVLGDMKKEIDRSFSHLTEYRDTPIAQSILAAVDKNKVLAEISQAKSVRDILKTAQAITKKLETAQGSQVSQGASSHKTYGNRFYDETLKSLVRHDVVPQSYADEHKREARQAKHEIKGLSDHKERHAAAERAREEQERRELGELSGSMAFHMQSMMETSGRDRVASARELDRTIRTIFGKSLTKEDFPYNFEAQGIKTKIKSISTSGREVRINMQLFTADGKPMMDNFERSWNIRDGRPHIHNDYMKTRDDVRDGLQIGNLINAQQRKLMKSLPSGGTVTVYADLDVGGYCWAQQGFSFESDSDLRTMKQKFSYFLQEHGIQISNAHLSAFKDPVHFAQFGAKSGKKFIIKTSGNDDLPLSAEQKASKSLTGKAGEHPLSPEEIRSGKTQRMAVHLGKKFLLQNGGYKWNGQWDSGKQTDATKYAEGYYQMRSRASELLAPNYQEAERASAAGESRTDAPTPTTRSSLSSSSTQVTNMVGYWQRRPGSNIVMSESRIKRVMRLSPADREEFLRVAPITRAAKDRIRAAIRGSSGS